MKLEYLYCKERLEEEAEILAQVEADKASMTDEEKEEKRLANDARLGKMLESFQERIGIYDAQAFKLYRQYIRETREIARSYGLDLKAEWSENSGRIELAFDMMFCESTANPLRLQLSRLFERCSSYSFMPVRRYGQELAALNFYFSFIYHPFSHYGEEVLCSSIFCGIVLMQFCTSINGQAGILNEVCIQGPGNKAHG